MRSLIAFLALLFPAVAAADVYLVKSTGGPFVYGHVAVDASNGQVAEFQRSPDGLIYTDKAVFMARYQSVGIDVVQNGLVYDGPTRWDSKRYIVFPVTAIWRSSCVRFVSSIDPHSRPINLPDVYAAKLKRQMERGK